MTQMEPENDPYRHAYLKAKATTNGIMHALFNWWLACRTEINPFSSPYTKLKFKCIKDLHINPDTLKVIERKVENLPRRYGHRVKIP